MFDPYLDWLKIPPERRPPTHYELLGLAPFESDTAHIHKAVMERMALVRRYQLGEHAETVTRLLGELSAAFNCLSDTDRRREYDSQLQAGELPATQSFTQPASESYSVAPVAETAHAGGSGAFGTTSSAQQAVTHSRRRRPSRTAWVAIGLCAALVLGVVLANRPSEPPGIDADPSAGNVSTLSGSGPRSQQSGSLSRKELPETSNSSPSEEPSTAEASTTAGSAPSGISPAPVNSHIRYFGYGTSGPPAVMEEIATYTNIVFVRDWLDRSNETIIAAEKAGLPIVLCINGKEMGGSAEQLGRVLNRRSGSVVAVCWIFPYLSGAKPTDVVRVGNRIKQDHPDVQFWMASGTRQAEEDPIPPVVDTIVVVDVASTTRDSVRTRADEALPEFIVKAAGRPIIWYWFSGSPRGPRGGVVPEVGPGTFRAALEIAQRYQLAGLAFEKYGDPRGQDRVPLNSRPEIVRGIRAIARELGFDKEAK